MTSCIGRKKGSVIAYNVLIISVLCLFLCFDDAYLCDVYQPKISIANHCYFVAKSIDNIMDEKNITFEDLPKAMSWMMDKLDKLDSKIDGLSNTSKTQPTDL